LYPSTMIDLIEKCCSNQKMKLELYRVLDCALLYFLIELVSKWVSKANLFIVSNAEQGHLDQRLATVL
jgi:hypothetical protein